MIPQKMTCTHAVDGVEDDRGNQAQFRDAEGPAERPVIGAVEPDPAINRYRVVVPVRCEDDEKGVGDVDHQEEEDAQPAQAMGQPRPLPDAAAVTQAIHDPGDAPALVGVRGSKSLRH
jgi:hypothetical protein